MEARIITVEQAVSDVRERLVRIESQLDTFATKEDLHREISGVHREISGVHREISGVHREIGSLTWKLMSFLMSFGVALVGAVYYISTHTRIA